MSEKIMSQYNVVFFPTKYSIFTNCIMFVKKIVTIKVTEKRNGITPMRHQSKEIDKSYTAQQMIFIKFLYIFKVLSIRQTKYERFDINTRFSNKKKRHLDTNCEN